VRSFDSKKFAITFATSGATSVDVTIPDSNSGVLLGVKITGHSWAIAGHAASGASGGVVKILDSEGDAVLTFSEVLTGSKSFALFSGTASAGVVIEPNAVIRYQFCSANTDARCVSAGSVANVVADLPTASVRLYLVE
jgi:hypothetical protein